MNDHDIIISDLLEVDVDVDFQDTNGYSALMLACLSGCVNSIKVLLEYDADVDVTDNKGLYAVLLLPTPTMSVCLFVCLSAA